MFNKKNMMMLFCMICFFLVSITAVFSQSYNRVIELRNPVRMNGQDVLALQNRLLSLKFNGMGNADGYYGPLTEGVIKEIQAFLGFEPNGKVERTLWNYIFDNENTSLLVQLAAKTIKKYTENGFTINEEGVITAFIGQGKDIIIPDHICGIPVTAIGDEAFRGSELTSVTIPEGVKSIGRMAFYWNRFTSINIPLSVSFIGDEAFLGYYTQTITIGANVYFEENARNSDTYHTSYYNFTWNFPRLYNANGKQPGTYEYDGSGIVYK